MTNEELYRQYLSGDAEAFERLYLQMQGFIASVAVHFLPSVYGGIYVQQCMDTLLFSHHVCLIQVTTAPGLSLIHIWSLTFVALSN